MVENGHGIGNGDYTDTIQIYLCMQDHKVFLYSDALIANVNNVIGSYY